MAAKLTPAEKRERERERERSKKRTALLRKLKQQQQCEGTYKQPSRINVNHLGMCSRCLGWFALTKNERLAAHEPAPRNGVL